MIQVIVASNDFGFLRLLLIPLCCRSQCLKGGRRASRNVEICWSPALTTRSRARHADPGHLFSKSPMRRLSICECCAFAGSSDSESLAFFDHGPGFSDVAKLLKAFILDEACTEQKFSPIDREHRVKLPVLIACTRTVVRVSHPKG